MFVFQNCSNLKISEFWKMFLFENCLCLKNDQILKNYLVYQINKNEFKNLHFKKVLKFQKIFIFYTTSKLKVTRGQGWPMMAPAFPPWPPLVDISAIPCQPTGEETTPIPMNIRYPIPASVSTGTSTSTPNLENADAGWHQRWSDVGWSRQWAPSLLMRSGGQRCWS
jgi:hypothetical protein